MHACTYVCVQVCNIAKLGGVWGDGAMTVNAHKIDTSKSINVHVHVHVHIITTQIKSMLSYAYL